MFYEFSRKFRFEAVHYAPSEREEYKNIHGYTYALEIFLKFKPEVLSEGTGIGATTLKEIVQKRVIDRLNHTLINDHIENPTTENIVKWIYENIKRDFKKDVCVVSRIKLSKSPHSAVELHCI